MPLDFINGVPEGANQEAVAYLQSDEQEESDYEDGSVVAHISDLVAIDGPEDVLAYVNDEDAELNEVAQVDIYDGEVVLSVGSDGPADDSETVDVDGGLFFRPDEAVSGDSEEAQEVDDTLTEEDEVFIYEVAEDEYDTVDVEDGIHMVVQASGY